MAHCRAVYWPSKTIYWSTETEQYVRLGQLMKAKSSVSVPCLFVYEDNHSKTNEHDDSGPLKRAIKLIFICIYLYIYSMSEEILK